MDEIMARVIQPHQARVNITYKRQYGELPDAVTFDSTDGDVRGWVAEAIRTGSVPGIDADPDVRLNDYVIDRFPPVPGVRGHNLIDIRPKVEFG